MLHSKQNGYGMPAYRGVVMQRGYGLGGMFKGLFKALTPTIKSGLKQVGKKALKTGVEVLSDVTQGGNLKQSLKKRSMQNVNELFTPTAKKQKRIDFSKNIISTPTTKQVRRARKQRKRRQTLGIL